MGLGSYYTYGLPTFTVIVIALYLLFTGKWSLRFNFMVGFAETRRCRLGRSFQRRSVPRGDESLCVGLDRNRIVHRSQRPRRGVVRSFVVGKVERTLTLILKGNLRYWCFDSRWWCTSTPDTDQELDQASLRVFRGTLFVYPFTVSFSAKSLRFTVLCAASRVPHPYNSLTVSL